MDERTRAHWITSNDEVRVAGIAWGDRRSVFVIPSTTERYVVALDSWFLGADFDASVRKGVPAELLDDVLAWLDHPTEAE